MPYRYILNDSVGYDYSLSYFDTLYRARVATLWAIEKFVPLYFQQLYSLEFTSEERHRFELEFSLLRDEEAFPNVKDPKWSNPHLGNNLLPPNFDGILTSRPILQSGLEALLHSYNMWLTEDNWFVRVSLLYLTRSKETSKHNSGTITESIISPLSANFEERMKFATTFFAPREWNPRLEPRLAYEKRARVDFEFGLELYLDGVAEKAKKNGIEISYEPHGLRDGFVPNAAIHLVRYQMLGENFTQIALASTEEGGYEDFSSQAVGDGVQRFAKLVGVPLRSKNKGGRPRKPRS